MKCCYSTDLTDAEWECLEPHVSPPNKRGRPKTHTTPESGGRQVHDLEGEPLPLEAIAWPGYVTEVDHHHSAHGLVVLLLADAIPQE